MGKRKHDYFHTGLICSIQVLEEAKMVLLWSATPDSVANLKFTKLCPEEQTCLNDAYFKTQAHGSLMEYLQQKIGQGKTDSSLFAQVIITTMSSLLRVT